MRQARERPYGFAFDDRDDNLSLPHSLVKTHHARERYPHPYKACFVPLPNRHVGLHNPPFKGAQRLRWHIDLGSGSDTICNSPDHPLARYCPLWHKLPHGFAFDYRDDSLSPHTHSSKCVKLGSGIHTFIRHASFRSPTDVGLHNSPL
ncbi:hypothetical protein PIB30_045932 [Stylosanthes scabra]|uniref:Uncharacterized protein n=1 Tax=Stylosanthes scabra TaxID=79078 RepID=A0ABU6ZF22_9FABA|nr:hypothetical protein [Stylosanthes scabra]